MQPESGQMFCPTCEGAFPPPVARCPKDGTSLVHVRPPSDPLIGAEIDGRYTIRERLGAGGMGTVYRALQHSVGRDVAVKVIQRGFSDETAVKRFMREAKLAASLSHPTIVSVVDFGQTKDGLLFLVMEQCLGKTLHQELRNGPMPVPRLIGIAVQLCDALHAAHTKDIIHRDLKPSNVIVLDEPAGRDLIKVLDFGLARSVGADDSGSLTSSGVMVGTPQYVSPEEILGAPIDARADLYSLGAVLYALANGQHPFLNDGGTPAVFARQTRGDLRPFAQPVPPSLERLIRRLLERSPDERPRSADAVRTMLLEYQSAAPVQLVSSGSIQVVTADAPRRKWPALTPLLAVLALGAGAAGWWASAETRHAPVQVVAPAPEPAPVAVPVPTTVAVTPAPAPAPKPSLKKKKAAAAKAADKKPCDPWCD